MKSMFPYDKTDTEKYRERETKGDKNRERRWMNRNLIAYRRTQSFIDTALKK